VSLEFSFYIVQCTCLMFLLDGEHSAGFLHDLGVKIEDISFFEGKVLVMLLTGSIARSAKCRLFNLLRGRF